MNYVLRFTYILLLIILVSPLYSGDTNIYIYQGGVKIGSYTKEEFIRLIKGYEHYTEIMNAQANDRLVVSIMDTPYKTGKVKNEYSAKFRISWENSSHVEINYLIIESLVTIPEEGGGAAIPEWRVMYRDISEIGFPISSVLFMICMIIIAL